MTGKIVRKLTDALGGFTRSFWVANTSELFERFAFYGTQSILVRYLIQHRGLTEAAAIRVNGNLGFFVYGLPILSGVLADLMGFRRAMLLAYGCLAVGYFGIRGAPSFPFVIVALALVALGASIIKPAITGTVQRDCSEEKRPVGFSIYYMLVNVGGALGPLLAGVLATAFGLAVALPVSGIAILVSIALVLAFYREPATVAAPRQKAGRLAVDFFRVLVTPRLITLFVLVAGFWSVFFQFYGALTTYVTHDLRAAEWVPGVLISADPVLIIFFQVLVGYLVRHWRTSRAVWIAAAIGAAASGVIGLAPSPWTAAAGVAVFSIGEMIYSAHFYKYLGGLAPAGQEGMYLGFAFLPIALGSLLAGQIGGPIAAWARTTLHHPEKMFWGFGAVGLAAAVGLWLHAKIFDAPARAA